MGGHFPQTIVLKLGKTLLATFFGMFGVNCGKVAACNPKVLQLEVSADDEHYELVGEYCMANRKGWQLAPAKVDGKEVRFVRITILENYGAEETVLQELFFGGAEPTQQRQTPLEEVVRLLEARVDHLE